MLWPYHASLCSTYVFFFKSPPCPPRSSIRRLQPSSSLGRKRTEFLKGKAQRRNHLKLDSGFAHLDAALLSACRERNTRSAWNPILTNSFLHNVSILCFNSEVHQTLCLLSCSTWVPSVLAGHVCKNPYEILTLTVLSS